MNDTEVSLKFKNSVTGDKKLEQYEKHLQRIYSFLNALDNKNLKHLTDTINVAKESAKEITNSEKSQKQMARNFNTMFNIGAISLYSKAVTNLFKKLGQLSQASSNYIENVNLLEVAYSNANETIEESSRRIETFIDKMADVYGLDESRLTRQFGIFKQLANAMKLPEKEAEKLSELMVKMTNDVASLYNLGLDRASNALQSALVGQVRPIRGATGADITEKTLQNTVDDLGLEKSISELSFVEKRLIMVISLTNQLKNSQGDYARTIESASNQIRVLHEQWDRLSRAVGNVFYPILAKILPYVNGIAMALTEIINMLASLLGFEMPKFDYSGLSSTSDAVLDLEDSLNGAGDSADKLKSKLSGLRSFDKLNVISTPKSTSKDSIGGTINPKIMDAFNKAFGEYDDKLDSVKMKARDIRDSIMEWLGFTKQINPFTGEISWKYEGIQKTLKNMWESFNKLSTSGKIVVGLLGLMFGSKIITNAKNLLGVIGKIVPGFSQLTSFAKTFVSLNPAKAMDKWYETNILVKDAEGNIDKVATKTNQLKGAFSGLVTAGLGIAVISASFKDIQQNGLNLLNGLTALTGEFITMTSVAKTLTSLGFSPLVSAIGFTTTSIVTLISTIVKAFNTAKDTQKSLIQKTKDYVKSLEDGNDAIIDQTKSSFALIEANKIYLESLKKIVGENGKVKKGYEERAEVILNKLNRAYGTEYELIEGQITLNGDQAQSYDMVKSSIDELIKKKKEELTLQAFEELYQKTIKDRIQLQDKIKERQEVLTKQTIWYNNALKGVGDTGGYTAKELKNGIKTVEGQLNELTKAEEKNNDKLKEYSAVFEAYATGNEKEIEKVSKKYGLAVDDMSKKTYSNLDQVDKKVWEVNKNYNTYDWNKKGKVDIEFNIDKAMKDLNNALSNPFKVLFQTKADGGIFVNGSWKNFGAYASGGNPPVGQMFLARENGPELVGSINNHTAVMNNDQIVSSVSNGVYRAFSMANKQQSQPINLTLPVEIGGERLGTIVIKDLQNMAKSNGKPIVIGG